LSINRQAAQAQIQQRQRDELFARADSDFNSWLSRQHPNFAKGPRRSELQRAVKDYLTNDLGMSAAQIDHHYRVTGVLRDLGAQKVLADAALFRIAKQNALNIASKRVQAPPVQRPGVSRPFGAEAEESVRALEKQLDSAQGQAALRIA